MSDTPRVRFAPSPTGYLHVGGARTALFNWLFARRNDGVFILRIEDTDLERSTEEMVRIITEGLGWLGMDWDEGPFFQSERVEAYREAAKELIDEGKAYRCFCDPAVLEAERKAAREKGEDWSYDGRCRLINLDESAARAEAGEQFALRFSVPHEETVIFNDHVYGEVRVEGEEIEDFVLLRSDGQPTYQLACVVDDSWMRITHVIRGADHLSNTHKQILLYNAFGMSVPEFAHLPLILGPDKKRLSKRHGATAVGEYRDKGYMPEAVVNFLSLLGWSPKDDTEFLRSEELITRFDLDAVNKKPAVFDEAKLEWLNGQYMIQLPSEELIDGARSAFREAGFDLSGVEDSFLSRVVDLLKERVRLFKEFPEKGSYFFEAPEVYEPESVAKRWKNPDEVILKLGNSVERLKALAAWSEEAIEEVIRGLAEQEGVGAGKYIHAIRVAVSGIHTGPGLFELLALLGQDEVVARIGRAVEYLKDNSG
ncbi:MAG: glutamate--tRNA ligase [Candidatus Latescibacteria bacterium]|nr:glutamate--tRNA ligase [Candidatus Latescibacterota bacterium]